jgi:hypothetical protein
VKTLKDLQGIAEKHQQADLSPNPLCKRCLDPWPCETAVLVSMAMEATNLMVPPEGWYLFGHHAYPAGNKAELEFWGTGADGLPIWERPKEE